MMPFPKHDIALYLTHNKHKSVYQTAEEWEHEQYETHWISDEERTKALATNELWSIQWYPDTPIGFCCLWASTLEALVTAYNREVPE